MFFGIKWASSAYKPDILEAKSLDDAVKILRNWPAALNTGIQDYPGAKAKWYSDVGWYTTGYPKDPFPGDVKIIISSAKSDYEEWPSDVNWVLCVYDDCIE